MNVFGRRSSTSRPITAVARQLLESSIEDPLLTCRAVDHIDKPDKPTQRQIPATEFAHEPALPWVPSGYNLVPTVNQFLEDLVTIAVNSARRAEDALQHAHQLNKNTRTWSVTTVIIVGLLMGLAGDQIASTWIGRFGGFGQQFLALTDQLCQSGARLSLIECRRPQVLVQKTTLEVPPASAAAISVSSRPAKRPM